MKSRVIILLLIVAITITGIYMLNIFKKSSSASKYFSDPKVIEMLITADRGDSTKAFQTEVTEHGTKFNQVIEIVGANGKIPVIFGWIKNNDGVVRLVTGVPTKR